MKAELAIYKEAGKICFVLLEDGQPAELLTDSPDSRLHRLDILLGQVRRVAPALGCAFIDIGDTHDAMLPLDEAGSGIKPGQRLVVQIRRETAAGKGHQVTARVQLPGPFAVFNTAGSPKRRTKLRAFSPDDQTALFNRDLERLQKAWGEIQDESLRGSAPRLLLAAGAPLYTTLTSLISDRLESIRVEGSDLFQEIYGQVSHLMPSYLPLLSLHVPSHGYGLAAVLSMTGLPDRLHDRKVWLDGGGFIIFDRTEAMTVIDVNSGKDIRGKDSEALRRRTNLQAAEMIARQLRLRNIGGVIIIDFIDLEDPAGREELLAAFRQALSRDRGKSRVIGFTGLGMLEMARTAV